MVKYIGYLDDTDSYVALSDDHEDYRSAIAELWVLAGLSPQRGNYALWVFLHEITPQYVITYRVHRDGAVYESGRHSI